MLELIFQGFLEWAYGLVLECWEYFSTALLDIMSMDFAYLKSHVPVMDDIMQVLMAVGWALLIGNLVFQALKSMASGLGFEGEDPKLLFTRTFVFSFLLLASPQICGIGLSLTAKIIDLLQIPTAVHVTLVDESVFGHLAASWLLVILFGVIVMFKVFRLLLEIAERYVILAVLTMTAPLAFAMGGSKSTSDIFSGWCRMFGSMCVLMTTHVIFFKMLLSVLATVPSALDVLPWIVLLLTIVKVARKADAIITRIGLNPAITGDSLGRMLPGALTYMIVRSATSRITRTIGRTTGNGSRGGFYGASPRGKGPRTGGPSGGQSAAGSSNHRAWQSARQTSGQQDFSAQSRDAQTGSVHSAAQEHGAYTAAQSSSVIQQTSFNKASERKRSAMPETRRVPESMPHGSYTSPNGIHDTAGKATLQTESGQDVVREAPKAGGDVRHSMQPNMTRAAGHGHAGTPEAPEPKLMDQLIRSHRDHFLILLGDRGIGIIGVRAIPAGIQFQRAARKADGTFIDLHRDLTIPKCLQVYKRFARKQTRKGKDGIRLRVTGHAVPIQRKNMTSAKLNTGTFRICARVFLPHGIAYPLNSSEKLRRVHLQGFAILYSSTLRIIFAGGNGKFRGSLTAEHLQLPILLGLLDKGEHQFSFKMGAGFHYVLCPLKNEGYFALKYSLILPSHCLSV